MSNRSLPMMPWYPDQFAASTVAWTFEEKGLYRLLLDMQWMLERLPKNDEVLSRACRIQLRKFRRLWKTVGNKFQELPDGTLQNYRLEQHRLSALAYAEGKRRGAYITNARRWSNNHRSAIAHRIAQRVADESPLSPSPSEDIRNPLPPLEKGAEFLEGNGRDFRGRSLQAWRAVTAAVDSIAASDPPQPWSYLDETVHDRLATAAVDAAGGCRLVADRDKFNTKDLQARFREAYERLLTKG